ncbi:MFS transporter [Kitasatospora sp. NPDC092039]|uniref:MFS transporter n=1 Tax=Kitasatospora sp. NPDC092039 TaxID=3364086 RepID=UPI003817AD2B
MRPQHRRGLALTASITGAVLVALDGTALTVARPALQHDLHASVAAAQWASTGYLVTVAALLVFAGRLGDRYGHRRVFTLGVAGFAASSLGIALAPGIGWVVALRVLQGVAGALLQPATLGMLRAAWPADRLSGPIAIRTAAIGLAAAAGPLVGGALTAHYGWRSVFVLGLLPAAAALLAALAVPTGPVPTGPGSPGTGRAGAARGSGLDLPGAALLALALACLVQSLVALPEAGWSAGPLLGLAAAGGLALALVRHERRTADPLLPPALVRSAAVAPPLVVLLAASAALQGALFPAVYYLQDVLGLDPLQSALRAVPLAAAMVLAATGSPWLAKRHGERAVVLSGMALVTAGALLTAELGPGSGTVAIGGCFALLGTGFGAVMATATAVLVRGASAGRAGVAGGRGPSVVREQRTCRQAPVTPPTAPLSAGPTGSRRSVVGQAGNRPRGTPAGPSGRRTPAGAGGVRPRRGAAPRARQGHRGRRGPAGPSVRARPAGGPTGTPAWRVQVRARAGSADRPGRVPSARLRPAAPLAPLELRDRVSVMSSASWTVAPTAGPSHTPVTPSGPDRAAEAPSWAPSPNRTDTTSGRPAPAAWCTPPTATTTAYGSR